MAITSSRKRTASREMPEGLLESPAFPVALKRPRGSKTDSGWNRKNIKKRLDNGVFMSILYIFNINRMFRGYSWNSGRKVDEGDHCKFFA
jgi:hypothetical protein